MMFTFQPQFNTNIQKKNASDLQPVKNNPFLNEGATAKNPFISSENKSTNPFLPIQTKLSIGQPNDKYEQEADQMADKVTQKSDNQLQKEAIGSEITPLATKGGLPQDEESVQAKMIQKDAMPEEEEVQTKMIQKDAMPEEEEMAQTKMIQKDALEEEEMAQTKMIQEKEQATTHVENQINNTKGKGQNLDSQTLNKMESGFGADFGNVKIHNDNQAAQMSEHLGAKAFTVGNDVYFNQGAYNPQSTEGQHLLAHELTHTIQQGASSTKDEEKVAK